MGAASEPEPHLRRPDAAGLHDPRRPAGDANGSTSARRTPRRLMALPPVSLVRQFDTHRLVPSRHMLRGDSVLVDIAEDDEHLQAIFELDAGTNDRLLAEHQVLPGIGLEELVFAVPHAGVVNAAFCHSNPLGNRFSGPDRGAWYAAFELATSHAEVAFHRSVQLAEI